MVTLTVQEMTCVLCWNPLYYVDLGEYSVLAKSQAKQLRGICSGIVCGRARDLCNKNKHYAEATARSPDDARTWLLDGVAYQRRCRPARIPTNLAGLNLSAD